MTIITAGPVRSSGWLAAPLQRRAESGEQFPVALTSDNVHDYFVGVTLRVVCEKVPEVSGDAMLYFVEHSEATRVGDIFGARHIRAPCDHREIVGIVGQDTDLPIRRQARICSNGFVDGHG